MRLIEWEHQISQIHQITNSAEKRKTWYNIRKGKLFGEPERANVTVRVRVASIHRIEFGFEKIICTLVLLSLLKERFNETILWGKGGGGKI